MPDVYLRAPKQFAYTHNHGDACLMFMKGGSRTLGRRHLGRRSPNRRIRRTFVVRLPDCPEGARRIFGERLPALSGTFDRRIFDEHRLPACPEGARRIFAECSSSAFRTVRKALGEYSASAFLCTCNDHIFAQKSKGLHVRRKALAEYSASAFLRTNIFFTHVQS